MFQRTQVYCLNQWRSQALKAGWGTGAGGPSLSRVHGRSPGGSLGAKPQKPDIYKQFDIDLATEFNIKDWVVRSHLKINTDKTNEIVPRKPRARYFHMPRGVYPTTTKVLFPLSTSPFSPPFTFSLSPPFPLLLVLPSILLLPRSGPLETS